MSVKKPMENKLFNGYVREPIPIAVIGAVVLLAFLALALWGTWDYFRLAPAPQTNHSQCTILAYEKDGPCYVLEGSNGKLYDIPSDALEDTSLLESLIDNQQTVIIQYAVSSHSPQDILSVATPEGSPLFTQTAIASARNRDTRTSLLILWGAFALVAALLLGSCYILCNAEKHPRLASILVRKEFRNF